MDLQQLMLESRDKRYVVPICVDNLLFFDLWVFNHATLLNKFADNKNK